MSSPDFSKRFTGSVKHWVRQPGLGKAAQQPPQSYSGVFARFSDFRLWIPVLEDDEGKIATTGPHIDLRFPSANLLISAMLLAETDELAYKLSGGFLGDIRMMSGYAARDGSFTYRIQSLDLRVRLKPGETRFRFSGHTGALVPESAPGWNEPEKKSQFLDFEITFTVPDALLVQLFEKQREPDAFRVARDRVLATMLRAARETVG